MSKAHLTGNWLMTATVCSFLFLLLLLLALEPGSLRAQTTSPTVPGAPKYIEGVRQDGRIWVHWGSPDDDGGAVVTGYDLRYIRSDADTTVDGNWTIKLAVSTVASWDYVMGLTNGVEYHVQVRAVNEVGAGAWSVSFTATPVEHPSPPVINSVTPGEGTLTVSWSAPEDDGGSDITEYRVRHIRSDAPGKPFIAWTEKRGISGSTLQYVIGGLTIGVRYDVQVRATNASGGGSDYSATVTGIPEERTVPSAPAISSVISFNEQLNIVWDAPSDTGGTIITAYDLRYIRSDAPDKADDNWTVLDSIWTSGTRAYGLGGLTNWVGYDVQVRAENSEGTGPWSATTTGTPGNLPSAPTIVKLFDIPGYFQVDWSAPADNGGAAIIDYHIRLTRGAGTRVYDDFWEPGDPLAQGFEAPGSSTEFGVEVRAVNPAGPGPRSAMVTFTTGSISAPVMVAGSPGDSQILVTWQAPEKGADGITTYDLRYIRSDADKSVGANWFLGEGKWSSGPLQYTITGLDNGVEYDVQVRAVRGLVRGPWSASTTARPGTTLASPTINSLTQGDGALVVAWSAPANSGDMSRSKLGLFELVVPLLDPEEEKRRAEIRAEDRERAREARNAANRRRRIAAKENGICLTCRNTPADPGIALCSKCRKTNQTRIRERYLRRKAAGLCKRCDNTARKDKTDCEECAKKQWEYDQRMRQSKRVAEPEAARQEGLTPRPRQAEIQNSQLKAASKEGDNAPNE